MTALRVRTRSRQPKASTKAAPRGGRSIALRNLRSVLRDADNAKLTMKQFSAFLLIAMKPGITGSELTAIMGVNQSMASRTLTGILGVGGRGPKKGLRWTTIGEELGNRSVKPIFLSEEGELALDSMLQKLTR